MIQYAPPIGRNIIWLDQVDSTNAFLRVRVQEQDMQEGTVVIAHDQTEGRGMDHNKWISQKGANLTFSIYLQPQIIPPSRQFQFSKIISVGIAEFLERQTSNVAIKWPNDLYIGTHKIGGLLIENKITGNVFSQSIAGIGLNINQQHFPPSIASRVTSLKNLTGQVYSLENCLWDLLSPINKWYKHIKASGAFAELDQAYLKRLYKYQEWNTFHLKERMINGKITGVDTYGRLVIETDQQETFVLGFKEVTYS